MQTLQDSIHSTFGNRLRVRVSGILIENDQILLVRHTMGSAGEYLWTPPGGGMNVGESAEVALKREFLEETGLEIVVDSFLYVHEFLAMPLHAIELFFEVRSAGGMLRIGSDPELPAEAQLIQKVAFLAKPDLDFENPCTIHSSLRDLRDITDVLQKKGYFYSEN
jgi:8-oxo-dGTP diphosphatase